jgi:signal recognition particle subunit SRP68
VKRRCRYLALAYIPVKRYGEALTLFQRSHIHLREARSILSTIDDDADPISDGDPPFFPLSGEDLDQLEKELIEDGNRFKNDWFGYNGGSLSADNKEYKKPLFFDIALNYVKLDMDRLQERAGKESSSSSSQLATAILAPAPVRATEESPADKRSVTRAKVEEIQRPETPEPSTPAKGGLTTLLGGWWGRR